MEERDAFMTGAILAAVFVATVMVMVTVGKFRVESGEQFILRDSTYICTKTNELVEGEK